MRNGKAIIIGGGVAGLTAAFELLMKTDIHPIVLEENDSVGGIARTVEHDGNLMDIGGHRYFSKSDMVMDWWRGILPVADDERGSINNVLLERKRLSRIYYMKKFFDYPVTLSAGTIRKLGLSRTALIGISYARSLLFPITPERSLEDFFINRFGKRLYETFFRDYTEKVWGVPCSELSSDWGAQRVKGISVKEVVRHALKGKGAHKAGIEQKDVETSLIDRFLYPKLGAGQLWEEVASQIIGMGGEIHLGSKVIGVDMDGTTVLSVRVRDEKSRNVRTMEGDYFLSTMPVKDLVGAMGPDLPEEVKKVAGSLQYRDFISVGVLLDGLSMEKGKERLRDNWIYIQEKNVKMGRVQIFNNWSPSMVREENKRWLGLEYFCSVGDPFWNMDDDEIVDFAVGELADMGFVNRSDVSGSKVVRMPKAYPSYTGAYSEFFKVRKFIDTVGNLFLIGRNGMHRYNNMDHSMLSSMAAVENIKNGAVSKDNIWSINSEQDYHEKKDIKPRT